MNREFNPIGCGFVVSMICVLGAAIAYVNNAPTWIVLILLVPVAVMILGFIGFMMYDTIFPDPRDP